MSELEAGGKGRSTCRFCGYDLDSDLGQDIGLCPPCDVEANP